ncbi:nuclear transport factor 2 family protein [Paraburkholderia panacisoli]|uniref:Nuclear transport factor 2 family protein n=1 Tax=Paraburkholderia panacisoli TaxID=2603818 RepID=A0A5B0GC80_9BURK|nr:nuclear transport factor 2 family protein [Paraburkholderia panacisoli]KAA1000896.1 nuclear transport factor 2 family protein [Paraburkholderia panacisoli]
MSVTQPPKAAIEFVSKVYEAIDSMNEQGFANCLTENCTFVYANSDPVIGRANAAAASQNFLKLLAGIKHHLVNVWAFEDVIVSQISVTYTRKDGSTLTIPAVTIWKLQDKLIDECRIYVDISPLFER